MHQDDVVPCFQPDDTQTEQPKPFKIRGHLVHGIPKVGDANYEPECLRCNPTAINDQLASTAVVVTITSAPSAMNNSTPGSWPTDSGYNPPRDNGPRQVTAVQRGGRITYSNQNPNDDISIGISLIFIVGEMSGMGMLIAPWAVVNLGWLGFITLIAVGITIAHCSSCLNNCWMIVLERYPQTYPVPDPFPTIAMHAVGTRSSIFTRVCLQLTLFGSATIYLMLTAQSTQKLFSSTHPEVSFSTWLFVFSIALSSLMFLETPHNYCLVAVSALLCTITACYLVLSQILLDERIKEGSEIESQDFDWSAGKIVLAFGAILFSYGGAACFPVIPALMYKQDEFSRSIVASFMMLAVLFGSIVTAGYIVYSNTINPNIFMSLGNSWLSYSAIILMVGHMILGFVMTIKPLSEQVEWFFNTPNSFGIQRFVVRVCILLAMIGLGESVPNFIYLAALFGYSTVTMIAFVLPSIFYLRLCSIEDTTWPNRGLSRKSKLILYTIIIVALTSCVAAMFTGLISLIPQSYLPYFHPESTYSK